MLFPFWFSIGITLCFPKDEFVDLAHLFLFLSHEGPYQVAVISTCQDVLTDSEYLGYSAEEYLKLKIQRPGLTSSLEDPPRIDFIILDQIPDPSVSHWLRIGEQHSIPVLSIRYREGNSGVFAWLGTGPKRFQTYVNLAQLKKFGYRPELPYLNVIHLVDGLGSEKLICRTPHHEKCFPW